MIVTVSDANLSDPVRKPTLLNNFLSSTEIGELEHQTKLLAFIKRADCPITLIHFELSRSNKATSCRQ